MSYRTDNNLIAEIKAQSGIVSIIENYIALKKVGKDYVGLCPFHDDNKPSMRVNNEKGLFHCFACGAGGDVIAFYMKYHNLDFTEATKDLAVKAGIKYKYKESLSRQHKNNKSDLNSFYKINLLAEKFYIKNLLESNAGGKVIKYLTDRGLDLATIRTFKLGYSQDKWTSFVEILNQKNVPLRLAEKVGIIIKKNNSDNYYDRFRARIIFPIYDLNNKIAGFGGRTVIDDGAKYLNSPESVIYNKSKILYGLNNTRSFIREQSTAIVVEGYMDLLTLYCFGIKNIVATLGTSITSFHASLLKRIADKVILAFDGDSAGTNATYRAMDLLHNEGLVPYVIKMPSGDDPASYVIHKGEIKFRDMIANAIPLMNLYFEDLLHMFNTNKKSRSAAINDLIERLKSISDNIDRSYYIKKASELFGISEESIYMLLKTDNKREQNIYQKATFDKSYEYMLLKVLIKFPQLKEEINEDILNLIIDDSIKRIISVYLMHDDDITYIINYFDDTLIKSILTEIFFSNNDITDLDVGIKIFNDCLRRIRLKGIKNELRMIKLSLSKTNEESNHDELMQKYRDLVQKEKDLNTQIYDI